MPFPESSAPASIPSPSHPAVAHWRPATAADAPAIHELVVACDLVDHPAWTTPREEIDEVFERSFVDPARDTLLGFDAAGTLIAFGYVWLHPSRDERLQAYLMGGVDPAHRRRGLGRELLRWEHERALQALSDHPADLARTLTIHAEERDAGLRAIAAERGFAEDRWFTSMVRDLALDIPAVASAGALPVVPFDATRAEATRHARNDAFRDHYGSLPSQPETWQQFVTSPYFRPDLCRLALEGERVVAFALGSVNEDDWETQGYSSVYIDLIGVTRDHRGERLAPLVITELLRAASAAGLEKAVLDVDTESPTGANRLYGGLGFGPTVRNVTLTLRF